MAQHVLIGIVSQNAGHKGLSVAVVCQIDPANAGFQPAPQVAVFVPGFFHNGIDTGQIHSADQFVVIAGAVIDGIPGLLHSKEVRHLPQRRLIDRGGVSGGFRDGGLFHRGFGNRGSLGGFRLGVQGGFGWGAFRRGLRQTAGGQRAEDQCNQNQCDLFHRETSFLWSAFILQKFLWRSQPESLSNVQKEGHILFKYTKDQLLQIRLLVL